MRCTGCAWGVDCGETVRSVCATGWVDTGIRIRHAVRSLLGAQFPLLVDNTRRYSIQSIQYINGGMRPGVTPRL